MIEKEKLKDYANKLMFDLKEEEYGFLQKEIELVLEQTAFIEQIEAIKDVEPMRFPFITNETELRNDKVEESLDISDILRNVENSYLDQVKVPKVVS